LSRNEAAGALLEVHVHPGARENRVIGRIDGVLKVKIRAPARGGEANAALLRLLSELLGTPRSRMRIVRGERSREKRVLIEGVKALEIERLLEALPNAASAGKL
jgi:uncharacterized protein (TIGR00251 family)